MFFKDSNMLLIMMTHSLSHNKAYKKCGNCGKELTDFIAYIPSKGEACLKCYTRYAQRKERKP
jgi:hypothetical protein